MKEVRSSRSRYDLQVQVTARCFVPRSKFSEPHVDVKIYERDDGKTVQRPSALSRYRWTLIFRKMPVVSLIYIPYNFGFGLQLDE